MIHTHSWTCTREVCGVGPSRDELVRATLRRRLERGEEFMHYRKADIEEMLATSAPGSSPHSDPREGSLGKPAADPNEPRAVSASAPLLIPSEAESVSPRESVEKKAIPHLVPTAQVRQIAPRLK